MIENRQQLFDYSSFIKSTDISAISSILITKMGEIQSKLEETFFETSKPEKLSFETSKLNSLIIDERFHHISQRILSNLELDHESHLRFRLVCQSWNKQVDNPFFWIKNCKNTGQQPEELHFVGLNCFKKLKKMIYQMKISKNV